MKYSSSLLSEYDWLPQLPQHSRLPSFPWHTELNSLIKQTPCLPPVFQPPSLKFDRETSPLDLWKVRDWSPVINRFYMSSHTHGSSAVDHMALLQEGEDHVADRQLDCHLFLFLPRLFSLTQITHSFFLYFDPFHSDPVVPHARAK